LSNNKCDAKKGKVLLVDASRCFQKLKKNLENKNCGFSGAHIRKIAAACARMQPQKLMAAMGQDGCKDFNRFQSQVDNTLKTLNLKLSAPEKKAILTAVFRYVDAEFTQHTLKWIEDLILLCRLVPLCRPHTRFLSVTPYRCGNLPQQGGFLPERCCQHPVAIPLRPSPPSGWA